MHALSFVFECSCVAALVKSTETDTLHLFGGEISRPHLLLLLLLP